MRLTELNDGELSLWVARALASEGDMREGIYGFAWLDGDDCCYLALPSYSMRSYRESKYDPVNDWQQGRQFVDMMWSVQRNTPASLWQVNMRVEGSTYCGATLLHAACRAFVASKFGEDLTEAIKEAESTTRRPLKLTTIGD